VDLLAVPPGPLEIGRLHRQIQVADQLVDLVVAQHVGQVGAQALAGLALDLVDPLDERVEAAVLGDPLGRRLRADTRHAGQVVAVVADESREIAVVLRRHAVLLQHAGRIAPRHVGHAAHEVQDRDVVVDQLERVAVTRADQDLHALLAGLAGERGDHVVGLVAGLLDVLDAQRVEHLLDQRDLPSEGIGGGRAACLVVAVLLRTERLARHVERDGDVGGLLVAQHVDEHRREPEDGVRGLPRGGGEVLRRQRMERPVRRGMSVEQQQCWLGLTHEATLVPGYDTFRSGPPMRSWSRTDAITPVRDQDHAVRLRRRRGRPP
jgi:hypothetical protein